MHGTSERFACGGIAAWLAAFPLLAARQGEGLGAEGLAELEFMRRRGDVAEARAVLDEALAETPADFGARSLRGRCRFDLCDYAGALEDARAALAAAEAAGADPEPRAACARTWLELAIELGRAGEVLSALGTPDALRSALDPRDAWALGAALLATGQRAEARTVLRQGAEVPGAAGWEGELARARCQRALGLFERAAATLVRADGLARAGRLRSSEPDVLVELGDVYFEAYGEVDDALSRAHSPAELCREALQLHAEHEGARLLLFRLHRWNWQRSSQSPDEILAAVFAERPDSLGGLLLQASSALDDGDLVTARAALARLETLAPLRRDVQSERAALAWIEHRRDEAGQILARLAAEDGADSRPELVLGWHLLELYRFREALPFLERAVERDPRDWMAWSQLGRARANTGDEEAARAALERSVEVGEGRRNAWRDNTRLVLGRMKDTMVHVEHGPLGFLWRADEGAVLASYLPDFYARAREELAARYGHTPGPTRIEVFRSWDDFSVRSTGFQGFPALGVCFGPVVTAVSPLSELRGTFSWARTSFHEFTHVVHLGLSNNRCPRWVTEGLATWEEGERKKSWWRNMRRELLDAHANGEVIPLRRLNAAFRGPLVLFAYYQSGLLCRMLIESHGFPPMVRLLEAFDRGADLDQAFAQVFQTTPEEVDRAFAAFVAREVAALAIEPRWSPAHVRWLRLRLAREVPGQEDARRAWADDWCKVAWGSYLQEKRIDAEEALRRAGLAGELPPRGEFLRGELLLAARDPDGAAAAFRAGFERGGEDYRARMALGQLLLRKGQAAGAVRELGAAERAFPGFPDEHFSAELELAHIHEAAGHPDRAMAARMRWLEWNSGEFTQRVAVASWLAEKGRHAESERLWEEANQVDPFRRHLHLGWGQALAALGRHAEALREFRVGLAVSVELDGDVQSPSTDGLTQGERAGIAGLSPEEWDSLSPEERQGKLEEALRRHATDGADGRAEVMRARFAAEEPLLHGHAALALVALGRGAEAHDELERALVLDPACAPALAARARLEEGVSRAGG